MTDKVLHLKLLRLLPLFKSESEVKVLENVRFFQFDIYLLLHEINIEILCIYLGIMTDKVLHLKLLRLVSLFKYESEVKVLENVRFSQFDICLLLHDINSK